MIDIVNYKETCDRVRKSREPKNKRIKVNKKRNNEKKSEGDVRN